MNQPKARSRKLAWGLAYTKDSRPSWEPFSAFKLYQSEISRHLSTDMEFGTAHNIQNAVAQLVLIKPDILFFSPAWSVGCDEAKLLLDAFRGAECLKKTVFIDTCDGTSTPFLSLLADVDVFIKAHLFSNTELYLREYVGGYIFTDYLVNCLGWSIDKWHFGSSAKKEHLEKLRVGWSYGISRRNRALAYISSLFPMPWALRI